MEYSALPFAYVFVYSILSQRYTAETPRLVVYLHTADKYHRLTRRLSQEQKGLEERALMASPRLSHSW